MKLPYIYITAIFILCAVQVQNGVSQTRPNITVLYDALLRIKNINITNISSTYQVLSNILILDILGGEKSAKDGGNYQLTISGTAVNDIVGIGRSLCGAASVAPYAKEYADLIAAAKKSAEDAAPNTTGIRNTIMQLLARIYSNLQFQLGQLREDVLYRICPLTLFRFGNERQFYSCLLDRINAFDTYYKTESENLPKYEKTGIDNSKELQALWSKWYTEVVYPKYLEISNKARQAADDYYNTKCKINRFNIAEYTLNVAKNHYRIFQDRISTAFAAVNDLATAVSTTNYSQYTPDIRSGLNDAVASLRAAIAAVLASGNASVITEEIKLAANNMIVEKINELNLYVSNFSASALDAKREAADLILLREGLQKSYNNESVFLNCYNESLPYVLVEMSGCTNIMAYDNIYVKANSDVLNRLLAIKQDLEFKKNNYDSNFVSKGTILTSQLLTSSRALAYKLYRAAGLQAPKDVNTFVCPYGFTLPTPTKDFICVAVTYSYK